MNVLQDAPVGTEMGRILATDKDIDANGQIRYSIVDDPSGGMKVCLL